MLEFLNRLKSKQIESDISERAQWLGLVDAIASDNEPEESATLETLEHLGKSVEDLATAVELVKQRRQWTAEIAAVPNAKAELAKIEAERTAAKAELNTAIAKHNDLINPLGTREQQMLSIIGTADIARQKLSGTCTDTTLTDRIEKAQEAVRPIIERLRRVQEARYEILRDIEKIDDETMSKRLQAELDQRDAEIKKLESEQRDLQAEMSDAQASMLEVMAI